MRVDIISGNIDGFMRMFVQESLQKLGNLWSALASPEDDKGFSRMVVDPTDSIMLLGLSRCGYHDLLSFGTPYRFKRRLPTHIEFVRIIEDFAWFQVVSLLFNRLFFNSYSGSGLLTLCCGRLMTISLSLKISRTVSVEKRRPVSSAMKSTKRCKVQRE